MELSQKLTEAYDEVVLVESGLARIYQHIQAHDCACITAFRGSNKDCVSGEGDGSRVTNAQNLERNKRLLAVLMDRDYSATKIDGSWIYNFGQPDAKEHGENTFFVVNKNDDPKFISNMFALGKHFCQDSVLIKEKNQRNAYLYGTNNSKFPGLDKKHELSHYQGGIAKEFLSRIKGRPFTFTEARDFNAATKGVFFTSIRREILGDC